MSQTLGNTTIYPVVNTEGYVREWGLTKREYFAAMAMQGLLANEAHSYRTNLLLAEYAVIVSDELINALNKK